MAKIFKLFNEIKDAVSALTDKKSGNEEVSAVKGETLVKDGGITDANPGTSKKGSVKDSNNGILTTIDGIKTTVNGIQNIATTVGGNENLNLKGIIDDALNKLGHANILIAGKTGVGKSTLVNAVFEGNLAETGVGHPITQNMKEYSKEGEPVHIFDTRGFELINYRQIAAELKEEIRRRKGGNASEYIHLAWFCVSDESKRIENAEVEFINELASEIPVVLVLTKSVDSNLDFYKSIRSMNLHATNIIRVLALPYATPIGEVPAFGLNTLIDHTYEIIPDAAKAALAAAQKVNDTITKKAVDKVIAIAASSAMTVGAVPIPFSDAAVLAPIQIGMIASISKVMNLELNKAFLSTLVSSAAGVLGATITGRAIVSGLLKLIPGAGSVIGGTISAATAGVLTTAMGYAYYTAVNIMQATDGDDINPARLSEIFVEQLKKIKLK